MGNIHKTIHELTDVALREVKDFLHIICLLVNLFINLKNTLNSCLIEKQRNRKNNSEWTLYSRLGFGVFEVLGAKKNSELFVGSANFNSNCLFAFWRPSEQTTHKYVYEYDDRLY